MGARIRQCGVIRNFPLFPYFFIEFADLVHTEDFANHFIDWMRARGETAVEQPAQETIYAGFKRTVGAGRKTFDIHSAENPDRSAIIECEGDDRDDVRRIFDDYVKHLRKLRELPSSSPSTPR